MLVFVIRQALTRPSLRSISRGVNVSMKVLSTSTSKVPNTTRNKNSGNHGFWTVTVTALGALASVGVSTLSLEAREGNDQVGQSSQEDEDDIHINDPPPRPDLPVIPLSVVKEHNTEDSMWFTFRGAVYDMTFFKLGHPGGKPRLLMAAGQDLEPYWHVYRQHFRGHVVQWMEKYRVGSLSPEDSDKVGKMEFGDMYKTDPTRHPDLLPCTLKPFNGEPRMNLLAEHFITPNDLFYVRNHFPVPVIDPDEYILTVRGNGIKTHELSLKDLKTKFKKHEVVSTIQCAGNRREDMHTDHRNIYMAPHWVAGAISNAKWGGVKMRDLLRFCGVDVDAIALGETSPDISVQKHIQLEGYDSDETGLNFGASVPIDKAVDGWGDAIFAYEMNGEPLPPDHGFPVRAIVPGHAGVRQVKWLSTVIVSDVESKKPWQQRFYRIFAPDIEFETVLSHWPPSRMDLAPIIQEMPVQSLVCFPAQHSRVGVKDAREVTLKGIAWSGGGRSIERVDVSIDGGKTWTAADLYKPVEQRRNGNWAWTHFAKTIPLPLSVQKKLGKGELVEIDICSKAMNSDFNVQPEKMDPYWNAQAMCINHWYHVKCSLDSRLPHGMVDHSKEDTEFGGNTPSGGRFVQRWKSHGWTADPKHRADVSSPGSLRYQRNQ